MATKLSAVSAKTGTNADDLVYLASTSDNGSTYESKSIKISNLFSSVASGTDLGTFTGSTLSANASVKTALQELETAHEAEVTNRGTAISAAVSALVDAAPGTLDTLNEIAAAINDDLEYMQSIFNFCYNAVISSQFWLLILACVNSHIFRVCSNKKKSILRCC